MCYEVLFRKLKHNARFSYYDCLQYCNIDLGKDVGMFDAQMDG